jgi:hypothetical protein
MTHIREEAEEKRKKFATKATICMKTKGQRTECPKKDGHFCISFGHFGITFGHFCLTNVHFAGKSGFLRAIAGAASLEFPTAHCSLSTVH